MEFFGSEPLLSEALTRRYGLSALQIGALEALRPFKAEWAALTTTSFSSRDKAAVATYALVERVFERTPSLREGMEIGGHLYRQADGSWHVSSPSMSAARAEIGVGAKKNLAAPIADDSYFWHTHPSVSPEKRQAAGFSLTDLLTALETGRGMFVYQNGRPYRLDIANTWRAMGEARRNETLRSIGRLAGTVKSTRVTESDRRVALAELRAVLRADLVSVTVFERSGVNPAAGQSTPVMPVSLWTDQGSIELIPNPQPPARLGGEADASRS